MKSTQLQEIAQRALLKLRTDPQLNARKLFELCQRGLGRDLDSDDRLCILEVALEAGSRRDMSTLEPLYFWPPA